MPIYEYECGDCGTAFEHLQGVIIDESPPHCPVCGSVELTRLLSRSVVTRNGGGLEPRGGKTCCGRKERCEAPPCNSGGDCRR